MKKKNKENVLKLFYNSTRSSSSMKVKDLTK